MAGGGGTGNYNFLRVDCDGVMERWVRWMESRVYQEVMGLGGADSKYKAELGHKVEDKAASHQEE